jgi:hypothetical protein
MDTMAIREKRRRNQGDPDPPIDWRLTTWEGARRERLRRWSRLPLERIVAALEEMAEQQLNLQSAPGATPGGTSRKATSAARAPSRTKRP